MRLISLCALLACVAPTSGAWQHAPLRRGSETGARARPPLCRGRLFEPQPLLEGEEWEGLVSKITDYGAFVRLGHEQHIGLVHIRTLADGVRIPRQEVTPVHLARSPYAAPSGRLASVGSRPCRRYRTGSRRMLAPLAPRCASRFLASNTRVSSARRCVWWTW